MSSGTSTAKVSRGSRSHVEGDTSQGRKMGKFFFWGVGVHSDFLSISLENARIFENLRKSLEKFSKIAQLVEILKAASKLKYFQKFYHPKKFLVER